MNMRMRNLYKNTILIMFFSLCCSMAKGQTNIKIVRYDSIIMYQRNIISQYEDLKGFSKLLSGIIIKNVEKDFSVEENLFRFYNSYKSLRKLYDDTQNIYTSKYRHELDSNMTIIDFYLERLYKIQPNIPKADKIFLFISALHENIIVYENIIGIALDRYLGMDYYMYPKAMTKWKIQFSDIHRMPLDALKGYIVSHTPIQTNKLLTNIDYLKYWANIYDILSKVFEDYTEQEIFGFTDIQYEWVKQNIDKIYKNAILKGDLDTYNQTIIEKYFGELPEDKVLPSEAPRQIGKYLAFWMLKTNKLK